MPSTSVVAMSLIAGTVTSWVRRSDSDWASPRAETSIASVTMNGTNRPYAMSTPLTSPAPIPTSSAQITMTNAPYDWVASVVAQTDANATSAPTDRSIPPPMMTNVMPTVTTPMIDALTRMLRML